ncbi:unnamed protein product [Gongylonema pulchrum]|uniref:RRM domain-containing protein n=1 Tax=Gongylonema pulchrum TaxID=637853 RepID=A0A183DTG6_9BILA|nr:unnamed protein product [Gongylonema pulchrum]
MVKLFVGGLPDGVDSMRLRQLFSQFVVVNECDVIKDYAFVCRLICASSAFSRPLSVPPLIKLLLSGRSTSKLRKEPGMDKRCFRCGAVDHKTPQCLVDPANANLKRAATTTTAGAGPEQKRFASDAVGGSPSNTATLDSSGTLAYPNGARTAADADPELPRPLDADLFQLYEQYIESRTKYFYFRDRLSKEVKARTRSAPSIAASAVAQAPYTTSVMYSTPPPSSQHYTKQQFCRALFFFSFDHFFQLLVISPLTQKTNVVGQSSTVTPVTTASAPTTYQTSSTSGALHFYANAVSTGATAAAAARGGIYSTVAPQPTHLY